MRRLVLINRKREMRQLCKFLLVVATSAAVMLLLRLFVFGIYRTPVDINNRIGKGDCVFVNKLGSNRLTKSDVVAFRGKSGSYALGEVMALPGDTLSVSRQRYVIPHNPCPKECDCNDCDLFLLYTGYGECLVFRCDIAGKAYRLWNLPW